MSSKNSYIEYQVLNQNLHKIINNLFLLHYNMLVPH
jgi:hypothetical protein